jgi:hypothetical protein
MCVKVKHTEWTLTIKFIHYGNTASYTGCYLCVYLSQDTRSMDKFFSLCFVRTLPNMSSVQERYIHVCWARALFHAALLVTHNYNNIHMYILVTHCIVYLQCPV